MDPYLGEIRLVGFNFAPRGWAFCTGQLLPISQNTALFALLGTTYGGDGRTTFALPKLQGNIAVGAGQGPGLSNYSLGQAGGAATVTLLQQQIPAHTHTLPVNGAAGGVAAPSAAAFLGSTGRTGKDIWVSAAVQAASPATMASTMAGPTGSSQPHNNLMPFVTLSYVIALTGIFPERP